MINTVSFRIEAEQTDLTDFDEQHFDWDSNETAVFKIGKQSVERTLTQIIMPYNDPNGKSVPGSIDFVLKFGETARDVAQIGSAIKEMLCYAHKNSNITAKLNPLPQALADRMPKYNREYNIEI